jgi:hypothetical protein
MTNTETQTNSQDETNTVDEYFTAETYGPYGMRKVVNVILRDLGVDKVLPGPMFYTYAKKGYIPTVAGSEAKVILREDAVAWTEAYLTKLVGRLTKASVQEASVPEAEVSDQEDSLTLADLPTADED